MDSLQLNSRVLEGSTLKLLDGALAPLQGRGNLPDALLLHEAQTNHTRLGIRKPVHQLKEDDVPLDLLWIGLLWLRNRIPRLPAGSLVAATARDAIRSNQATKGLPRHSNLPRPASASRKTSAVKSSTWCRLRTRRAT